MISRPRVLRMFRMVALVLLFSGTLTACHELYCGFVEGLTGEPLDCSHEAFPDLGDIDLPPLPPATVAPHDHDDPAVVHHEHDHHDDRAIDDDHQLQHDDDNRNVVDHYNAARWHYHDDVRHHAGRIIDGPRLEIPGGHRRHAHREGTGPTSDGRGRPRSLVHSSQSSPHIYGCGPSSRGDAGEDAGPPASAGA